MPRPGTEALAQAGAPLDRSARPPEGEDAPDPRRWKALAVIAVAQLMVVLDATIVNIALPSAQRALHISTIDRQWVITAYTLAFGGLLLLGGRIADFVGRKRMFIVGLIGFGAASALGGLAQDPAMLFGARALQGAFGALMAPASLALLTVTFTEAKERATAFAVYGAIAGGGSAVGLLLGGILTEYASWRWCLLVNAPVALFAAIAGARLARESRAAGDRRYDLPGAVSVTLGLVAVVYGFQEAYQSGWSATSTLGLLAAGVALLVLFVAIELRTAHPLLPMRVLADRNRGGSFLGSFMAGVGLFGMFLFMTYYLQVTLGYSALKTGFAFLPFSGAVVLSAALASKALPRFGPRPLMTGGFLCGVAGVAWLTGIGVHSSFAVHVLPAELVMSAGLGFAFVALSSTALVGVADHDAGVASALVNATQQVGGSLGTALLNTVAASATATYLALHGRSAAVVARGLVHGYAVAFVYAAAFLGIATVAAALLVRARKEELATQDGAVAVA
jgi:EmrB/QacA subfamily drug resistance transporter